ncbi:RHS repeat-associated core domain-containing protein [Natranaerofaba carboxydovora]|uniref:RHS repeat-associated core domain-containing protein n=1 Tax=Natranaerofaba carboxydovora TaxID=2742683 RepID=UPI001F131F0E|nr:RHS repeat-associated core domain-containing protein [Natranaerofaba carboxydovora]UMZ73692.1 tRNA3(Ser)-specific nuclease WapA [Natranaerofaba carboxydovora]
MTFEQAGRRYLVLREQLDSGAISYQEFDSQLDELLVETPDGKTWRIDASTGTWMEREKVINSATEKKIHNFTNSTGKNPETLFQLLIVLVKGVGSSIPRIIMLGLIMSFITWVSHTYLVARVNDGLMYRPDMVTVNSIVHLQDTHFAGVNAFWGLLAYFISSFIVRARSMGFNNWLENIKQTPNNIQNSIQKNQEKGFSRIVIGVFIALFISLLYRNFMFSGVMALGMLLILTAHFKSLEIMVLKVLLGDLQRLSGKRFMILGEEYDSIFLVITGMAGGFLLAGLMRAGAILLFVACLLSIGAVVFLKNKEHQRFALSIIFLGGGLLFLEQQAMAYCEGGSYSQAGSWSDWWGSENADLVRQLGLLPAGSTFLGGILGGLTSAISPGLAGSSIVGQGDIQVSEPLAQDVSSTEVSDYSIDLGELNSPIFNGGPGDNPNIEYSGGNGPSRCSINGLPNYYINTSNLGLVIQDTIYSYNGAGPKIDLTITYNSNDTKTSGMFGNGWSFAYDSYIYFENNKATLRRGSGQELIWQIGQIGDGSHASSQTFAYIPDHSPIELIPSPGNFDRLLLYQDHWLYIEKSTSYIYYYQLNNEGEKNSLLSIMDYNGNKVILEYDNNGNLSRLKDASSREITFEYAEDTPNNMPGVCSGFSISDGRSATFKYDEYNNLTEAVDFLGVITCYEYHPGENLINKMTIGRKKKTTIFGYKETNGYYHIDCVTDARGKITKYELISLSPAQVKTIYPGGNTTTYESETGLTKKVIDHLGNSKEYSYENGLRVSFKDENENISRIKYDTRGNKIEEISPSGYVRAFEYDNNDNLIGITSPSGDRWSYEYDNNKNLIKAISPSGNEMTQEYNDKGEVISLIDHIGEKLMFYYDDYGNLTKKTDQIGHSTCYSYDEWGYQLLSTTDANGNTTYYEYDENDRVTKITHSDDTFRSHIYDCCAALVTTDEVGGNYGLELDPLLNIISEIDPLMAEEKYVYDDNNNLVEKTDALGNKIIQNYDTLGRLSKVQDSAGSELKYQYDRLGNLVGLVDKAGNQNNFTYTPDYEPEKVTDGLSNTVTKQIDYRSRIKEMTNARGNNVALKWDSEGRNSAKYYDGEEVAAFKHDANGNLTEIKDQAGVTSYEYDSRGNMTAINYPDGYQVKYSYDPAGNITSITYPGEVKIEYTYDSRNRITSMAFGENKVEYKYDSVGNLLVETRSNNTITTYDYDKAHRLTGLKHSSSEEVFCEINYLRDLAGNIIEEKGTYPVDPLLALAKEESFDIETNEANQAAVVNNEKCIFDDDGNLISWGEDSSNAYNQENQLVECSINGEKTTHKYDGLGHRFESVTGNNRKRFFCDQQGRVLFEKNEKAELVLYLYCNHFLAASLRQLDEESNTENYSDQVLFYHFDKTGNTLALTDKNGEIKQAYAYSPYGTVVKEQDKKDEKDKIENPFTYVGAFGVMDEGNGLFFMKTRYYQASTGRFIQKDPIGLKGGINFYAYADNNPLLYIDPEGTFVVTLGVVLTVGTVAAGAATAYGVGRTFNRYRESAEETARKRDSYYDAIRRGDPQAAYNARDRYAESYNQTAQRGGEFAGRTTIEAYSTPAGLPGEAVKLVCGMPGD